MSANINQEMSCFSVILCDHCKTRGRLFNKHHILSINNNPFPGTRSHWLPITTRECLENSANVT